MIGARMIFNDEFFVRAWESDIPIPDIARTYGTSRAAIYRAARYFKLQPRYVLKQPPAIVHPADPPPTLEGALLWSRGKWSLLSRVADEHGLTSAQVQAAYHRIRSRAE